MKINFSISEFIITGDKIPVTVADKILKYHISPMCDVRKKLGVPIFPSQNSGYRPVSWEKSHGRSGNSQHTFKEKGAVDWTCNNFSKYKNDFLRAIYSETSYTRIAIYNTFIHCDYKDTPSGKREVYTSDSNSKWTLKETL